MRQSPFAGFSLIELMITLSIAAFLMLMGMPAFTQWMANARVRSAAESLQNSIRVAQTEAVRRNRQAVFALTAAAPSLTAAPAVNSTNWYVRALPLAGEVADATFYVNGEATAGIGITLTGPSVICFNSMGRVVANAALGYTTEACASPADAVTPTNYNVSRTGSDRPLRIQVFLGGKVRMCDPAKALSASPDGCVG